MIRFIVRRLLLAIPTLLAMSLLIFLLLDLAPSDPTSNLPLTIPQEQREKIRESLGVNDPVITRYAKWARQLIVNEPLHLLNEKAGICVGDCENLDRMISFSSRSPAMDTIYQRMPQTLWVLGLGVLFGVLLAVPIGAAQANRQYSWFDNAGTVVTLLGFSVPVFVIGPLFIWLFSIKLGWLPTFYKTTHDVVWSEWSTIWFQMKQLFMPVATLTLFYAASFGRFTRGAVLENLNESYVRTARSKGLKERAIMNRHVLRNSLIPVVTLLALTVPSIFAGAIITENIFRINGLGDLLLLSIGQSDFFMTQTLVFIFAVLTVLFNILADVLYGVLDPRIRYD